MDRVQRIFAQVATAAYVQFFLWKLAIFGLVFLNLWAFFGEKALPPDGSYFHLWMIFIAAHFGAKVTGLFGLPPLLGMMIAGFIYGNVLDIELEKSLTSILRSLALMVILLRAGLSLDPAIIRKLSFVCFRLSFVPCAIEAVVLAVLSYFEFGLSISWALMLGFVVASVSPAVVVPSMIELQEKKIGVVKGIPTLITAAASVDNVFAITGFSVCFSLSFSNVAQSSLLWSILKGPTEAIVGVLAGLLVGFLLWFIPERCHPYPKNITAKYNLHRFIILLASSMFALFGSKKLDFSSSGPLAILVLSFVASLRWRPFGYTAFNEDSLKKLWLVLENYLFCLIAADVRLKTLQSDVILYALICLLVALSCRVLAAFLVTFGIGLNYRERLFTAIAWIPKASVQAAIGSAALDAATNNEELEKGRLVLTVAVLSILITAPLGAVAMDYCARPMLGEDEADRSKRSHKKKDYEKLDDTSLPSVY